MNAIWMKKGIMTLMAAAVTMSPEQTASEPDHWEYEASQDFTVTSDGVYQFELYGAQGGSYQEHTGGKGGGNGGGNGGGTSSGSGDPIGDILEDY